MAWEDPANQHHLDHVNELDVFIHHALNVRLQRYQLVRRRPIWALLYLGGEPHWGSGLEFGSRGPGGVAGLCDVEPQFLALLDSLIKSTFGPCDIGQLAHHGAPILRVLGIHHLRLHIEDLEP